MGVRRFPQWNAPVEIHQVQDRTPCANTWTFITRSDRLIHARGLIIWNECGANFINYWRY
ncbi:MAG: hypothetical protein AB4038_04670 [Prochloraceae cyanobacterium]